MGAGAQVHELALLVEGDDGVLRQVVDELHLVGLSPLLHVGDGLLPGQLEALQLQLLLADLPHLCLQLLHLGLGEGLGGVEVVVEAVVDAGADGQLHLRVQALHGLGQHVGAGVPVGLAVGLIFKRVQVFFAHSCELLSIEGQKNFTPDQVSGVKHKTPRFHPAYSPLRDCRSVSPVTGGTRSGHPGPLRSGTAAAYRRDLPAKWSPLCAPPDGFVSVIAV